MKIVTSLIRKYLNNNLSDRQIADLLTLKSGFDVESIEQSQGDTVFDLEITPNRGDCLSHFGIARELSAMNNQIIKKSPIKLIMSAEEASKAISVTIIEQTLCPRYYARVIRNVKLKGSPVDIQNQLRRSGVTPINNIVDATNYIMIDLGQPLHAFDADKIEGSIIVRRANNRELIKTLDGKSYQLSDNDLVIADNLGPIAFAGVIGGERASISPNTKNIVLEAAEFDPVLIRRTSKRLNISTEASYRFERGVDGGGIEYAINAAAVLIQELGGGEILTGIVKCKDQFQATKIKVDYQEINKLLGLSLSSDEINHNLKLLGFTIKDKDVVVPSWRHDIKVNADLAEEVGRVYGYSKIPLNKINKVRNLTSSDYYLKEYIKDILVSAGFNEQISYPFLSEHEIEHLDYDREQLLEIKNPTQKENKYLRQSLVPGLLNNLSKNALFSRVKLFEINPVYFQSGEVWMLAICQNSREKGELKNSLTNLFKKHNLPTDKMKFMTFSPDEIKSYKIKKPIIEVAEIRISDINSDSKKEFNHQTLVIPKIKNKYRPVSKYPSILRDISIIVGKNIMPESIIEAIYKVSNRVNLVELFDEYQFTGEKGNKKSLAFHINFQSTDSTLEEGDVNPILETIIRQLKINFQAELRR